jgi:hypothetical protein
MQPEKKQLSSNNMELSNIWQELLGEQPLDADNSPAASESTSVEEVEQIPEAATPTVVIPTLPSDPWSELVQARGTEMIDLSQLQLHMSDQDVEQILQLMQEAQTDQ